MRKVVVNKIASLDGYFADPSGNPLALNMDAAFDQANLDSITAADLVLLGRDSFDGFSGYWPFVADAPLPEDPEAPEARAVSETNRDVSRRYNELPKVVVTDRGPVLPDNPWADTSTTVGRDEVATWLVEARTEGTGDILIFASHVLWNALLANGLIDELHLMISPTALGEGLPLFTGPASLELLEARRFDGSPNVQLRYAARPAAG